MGLSTVTTDSLRDSSNLPEEPAASLGLLEPWPEPKSEPDLPLPETPPEKADDVSQRLARLEHAVAQLPQQLADQIVSRLQSNHSESAPIKETPEPPPEPEVPIPVATVSIPSATIAPPVEIPTATIPLPESAIPKSNLRRGWLVWEILRDGGRTFWMLIDRSYSMAWSTRFVVGRS